MPAVIIIITITIIVLMYRRLNTLLKNLFFALFITTKFLYLICDKKKLFL